LDYFLQSTIMVTINQSSTQKIVLIDKPNMYVMSCVGQVALLFLLCFFFVVQFSCPIWVVLMFYVLMFLDVKLLV
jgi:uncharacterized protein (DUF983 family)